ncbi:asparagine synthase-related protein [Nocardia sp. IFM 10818]
MTSIALTQSPRDRRGDLTAMAGAMADRTACWRTAEVAEAAVAVGADSAEEAAQRLHTLPSGTVVAVSAPPWVLKEVAGLLAGLAPADTVEPERLARALGTVVGDAHCAALTPGGTAVVYRSPMAARACFYTNGSGPLRVSSTIRGLRAVDLSLAVDEAGLAAFLIPQLCDPHGSAFARVRRLPPGHALIARPGQPVTLRQTGYIETADVAGLSPHDLVAGFRARLLTAVRRCGTDHDALLLSGGIDSASLAAASVAGLPTRPRAYALTYRARDLHACDERRYLDVVEQATGMQVSRLAADDLLPLCAPHPFGDEPEAWTYAARNWAMLQHISADPEPVDAVFAGEGGDELLLGQVFAVADRQALGDLRGAAEELTTFDNPAGAGAVVQALLTGSYDRRGARVQRALREIPPWLSPAYRERSGLVDRCAGSYPELGAGGGLTQAYSRALVSEAGAAGRVHCGGWWEDTGRRAGVQIRYPFLDPDLAAWTWALPPTLFRDKGIEKVVLRRALPELPAAVATRRDKADARVLMRAGLVRSSATIHAVADAGPLTDAGIIDPAALHAAVDDYAAGRAPVHGPALWATVAVDAWLTHIGGAL